MLRWNLKIPHPLSNWSDRHAFEVALVNQGGSVISASKTLPWVTVALPRDVNPLSLPGVLFAEPDAPVKPPDPLPIQPIARKGVGFNQEFSWGPLMVGADRVHRYNQGEGIRIAVVDTGFKDHPEFDGANIASIEAVTGFDNAVDIKQHGTLVLGVMASQGREVLGVAPRAIYHIIKVFELTGTNSQMAEGIERATARGADVINLSFGAPSTAMVTDAIRAFVNGGGVICVSSGNDGHTQDFVSYPASMPETIAVGAINRQKGWANASFWGSGWGPWPNSPDCVAPGDGVIAPSPFIETPTGYVIALGTSIASPFVAGCIALSMSERSDLWRGSGLRTDPKYGLQLPSRVVRARELLRSTCTEVETNRDRAGYGLVDAAGLAPEGAGVGGSVVGLLVLSGLLGVGLVAARQRR